MKKRIVICADGTWNKPEVDPEKDFPTNVLKLARAIQPKGDDNLPQQVFYDWGIGSYYNKVGEELREQDCTRILWTTTDILFRITLPEMRFTSLDLVGEPTRFGVFAE